jgi:hypothetical protein
LGDNEQCYVIEGCDTLKLNKTIIYKKMHFICANFGKKSNKFSFSFLPSCVWITNICFALKLFVKSPYHGVGDQPILASSRTKCIIRGNKNTNQKNWVQTKKSAKSIIKLTCSCGFFFVVFYFLGEGPQCSHEIFKA